MLQGFKEFITRGNAMDLAVGVVIGAAFTQVVTALTEGILMPLISALFGQPNFDDLWSFNISLFGPETAIKPGLLLTAIVNFLLVALALYFVIVLPMNKLASMHKSTDADEEEVDNESAQTALLEEIRDALKASAKAEVPNQTPRH